MKKVDVVLVGILALHNKIDRTYSVNSVSRARTSTGKIEIVTQLGVDLEVHIPFDKIVHALCDVYANAVVNIWWAENIVCTKVYLQMHRLGQPTNVGLTDDFAWWAQR